jgi:hypothetical protein
MNISFAIPTKNRAETLKRSMANYLLHMDRSMRLHIVDNGSIDKTWNYLNYFHDNSTQVEVIRQPQGTHVKTGFLRALTEAAQTGDYVILMSDEDEIDWNVLPEFTEWLETEKPSFASTQFTHSEGFHRGRHGGTIDPSDWFASAFYCSGLVYRSEHLLKAAGTIWPRLAENHFLKIYAEAGLTLAMFAENEPMLWAPHHLTKQREQLDTHIVMDDGSRYWNPQNRALLAQHYDHLLGYLTGKESKNSPTWQAAKKDKLINTWRK